MISIYKLPKGGLPTRSSGRQDTTVTVDCSSTFALSSSKKKSLVLNSTPPKVYQQNAPKNAPPPKRKGSIIVSQALPKFFRSETVSCRVRVLTSFPIPETLLTTSVKNGRKRSWIWASDSSCSAWRQHRIWGNKQTQRKKRKNKTNITINQTKTKENKQIQTILLTVVHQKTPSLNSLNYLFRRCCCFS